jgi:PAS domain S-box-containing protein
VTAVWVFQVVAIAAFLALCAGAALGLARLARSNAALRCRADRLAGALEHAQDALWEAREREERYRSLIEGHGDLLLRRDAAGRVVWANDAFVALAGEPLERLIGSSFALPGSISVEHATASGAQSYDQEVETPHGTRWIAWVETPVRAASGGAEIQAVGRDVTERRAAEAALAAERRRAEAASEAKSRFLASVTHELRTPLNGVLGMAHLLETTGLTPEQGTYAAAIRTSGEALLSLITEILDFSKIEAGKLEIVHEPFDLVALVEGTVELLAPRAQDKGIALAASVAPDVARFVLGDAGRIRQVLTNLAGNAVKFTETGGVGVSVLSHEGRLVFAVSDTGTGIPADRLSGIFAEFEQVDGTATRRHEGTGLGLAISRRLVQGMGGDITVESVEGRGSVFRFGLALPAVPDAPERVRLPAGIEGCTALLVSPSPFEQAFLADRLTAGGVTVTVAETAEAGMRSLAMRVPDILVVDGALREPGVRALASAARAAGVSRRIVLLSPFERRSFGSPAAAGFESYLVKPVRERSLAARLDAPEAEPLAPARSRRKPSRAAPVRVLLAEDNEINALLATKLMERSGAAVTRAADGIEAVDLYRAACEEPGRGFDLVLMDVRMPGIDGHEAARRIRAVERDHGVPPVRLLALTANVSDEDRRRALAAGLDGMLAKPLDAGQLGDLLRAARPGKAASA